MILSLSVHCNGCSLALVEETNHRAVFLNKSSGFTMFMTGIIQFAGLHNILAGLVQFSGSYSIWAGFAQFDVSISIAGF